LTKINGTQVGKERTSASERRDARPHVLVLMFLSLLFFSYSISCPPHHLALDNKISFKLRYNTRYAFQSHSFPLSSPVPFNFPFSYTTRLVHSDNNTQLIQAASTRQPYTHPFYVVLVFPSSLAPSLFNPHHRHPRGHPTTVYTT
jgi:hypothetical protein